jgi:hypothetical protein
MITIPLFAAEQAKPPAPPPYTPVRWNEDYKYLAGAPKSDFFDPIKYIPLGSDPDWYLSFGGQARYRYEYYNNFNFSPASPPGPPQDEDGYHLIRLLAHADLHLGKNFRVFGQVKSSMIDDRDGGPRPIDSDEADVQQLFFDAMLPLGEKNSAMVRLGRQDLLYGAQRLISPLDWTNTRRTFEGGRTSFALHGHTIDAFWVHPVNVENEEPNSRDGDTSFAGVYATFVLPEILKGGGTKLEAYGLALNRSNALFAQNSAGPPADEDRYTIGAHFSTSPKPWDFDVEAMYQFGKFNSGDISAWALAAEAGYTFANVATAPRIFLGLDVSSGDDDPNDSDLETFNQLFPLGHAYQGYIDIVGRQNAVDLHPGVELTVIQNNKYAKKFTVRGDYHIFWRYSDDDAVYTDAAGAASSPPVAGILRADSGSDESFVGSELDISFTWQFDRHLMLHGGYSHFFAGDFIEETGAHEDIDFLYFQIQFTF